MIRVAKKFDIVMREMDEMMGDISKLYPHKISFNVMGDVCEFEDVSIELHNGFLKIIGDAEVRVIKYQYIYGYSLKSFNPPHIVDEDGDVIPYDGDFMFEEIWDDLRERKSTLPNSLLNNLIPKDEFERIICEFIIEYEGLYKRDEIFEDERIKEDYERWIDWYKSHSPSYGDLNESMSDDLWSLWYPSHILRDECRFNFKNGRDWSIGDYLWINDVISHYWSYDDEDVDLYHAEELFEGVDEDE